MKIRCTNSFDSIRKIGFVAPQFVLKSALKPKFKDLPLNIAKNDKAEEEYRKLDLFDWKKELESDPFKMTATQFWTAIFKTDFLPNLCRYILSLLNLPFSNAIVERVFSIAGSIKTKSRNRLSVAKLDALVRIRTFCHFNGICCNKFDITDNCIKNFNLNMYSFI